MANFEDSGSPFTTAFAATPFLTGLGIGLTAPTSKLHVSGSLTDKLLNVESSGSSALFVSGSGNVGIGTNVPSAKLHVKTNAATTIGQIIELSAAQTANAFEVRNSAATVVSSVSPDGDITITTANSSLQFIDSNSRLYGDTSGTLNLVGKGDTNTAAGFKFWSATDSTITSGDYELVQLFGGFAPTSGTGEFRAFTINSIIDQSSGGTGISRGILIDPVLIAPAEFRSIETTYGNVILGSTEGNVGIYETNPGAKLHVKAINSTDTVSIIEGAPTQVNNLTEWKDSGGSILSAITNRNLGF